MDEVLAERVSYVGRLAPSPTGALHLGNVRTFMIAWLRARACGGRVILRIEDLDHPRDKPGAAAGAVEDLRWLGFDWDETYVQSERRALYRAALEAVRDRVYPCVCSRRDVESAQSAPHDGEQLTYPGTCRGRFATWDEAVAHLNPPGSPGPLRLPCWRFRVPDHTTVRFTDAFAGPYEQDVSATLGDFPLARDADGAGYTFACTVDDLAMGVTEVVRGDDLLAATPAQILLTSALTTNNQQPTTNNQQLTTNNQQLTTNNQHLTTNNQQLTTNNQQPITYCHVPLVVGPDGRRLAKRHGDTRVSTYRAAGMCPEELVGRLAASCGWAASGERVRLADLVPRFDLATIPHAPFMV